MHVLNLSQDLCVGSKMSKFYAILLTDFVSLVIHGVVVTEHGKCVRR